MGRGVWWVVLGGLGWDGVWWVKVNGVVLGWSDGSRDVWVQGWARMLAGWWESRMMVDMMVNGIHRRKWGVNVWCPVWGVWFHVGVGQ